MTGQLRDEPGLADAGLAQHEAALAASRRRGLERLAESAQLGLAADADRVLVLRHVRRGAPGWGRLLLDDVLIEASGLGLGLRAQLPLEGRDAALVLAEGGAPAALPEVQAHQGAVPGFLERVEGEQPLRGADGALGLAGSGQVGDQPGERLQDELAEALALDEQPGLEGALVDDEALEEVAAVEVGGAGEAVGRAGSEGLLEAEDVHVGRVGAEGDALAVGEERGGEGAAESAQGVPEAVLRVGVGALPPQQGRQLVPGVDGAGREREIGEQGLGLLRERGGRAPRRPRLEAAEELDLHARHLARHYSRRPRRAPPVHESLMPIPVQGRHAAPGATPGRPDAGGREPVGHLRGPRHLAPGPDQRSGGASADGGARALRWARGDRARDRANARRQRRSFMSTWQAQCIVSAVVVVALVLGVASVAAADRGPRRFVALIQGNASPAPTADPCILNNTETLTGHAFHFGDFGMSTQEVVDLCSNPEGAEVTGADRVRQTLESLVTGECPLDIGNPSDTALRRYLMADALGQQFGVAVVGVRGCIEQVLLALIERDGATAVANPSTANRQRMASLAATAQQLGFADLQMLALLRLDQAMRVAVQQVLAAFNAARGTPCEDAARQQARTDLQDALLFVTTTAAAVLQVSPTSTTTSRPPSPAWRRPGSSPSSGPSRSSRPVRWAAAKRAVHPPGKLALFSPTPRRP
jgi:hypothetical protein